MKFSTLLAAALATAGFAMSAQAAPQTYQADPGHTSVTFETMHKGIATIRGRWDDTKATIVLDREAKTGSVDVTIAAASINTGIDSFNKHLLSKDFFDAEKHPTISFKGDKISFAEDGGVSAVEGQLTLLGQSKPVKLEAKHFACATNEVAETQTCGGDFETTIKRSDWGMEYALQMPGMNPEVRLLIQVEAQTSLAQD